LTLTQLTLWAKFNIMELNDFLALNPSFATDPAADQVLAIAWFWHHHADKRTFTYPDMQNCFTSIALMPTLVTAAFTELTQGDRRKLVSPKLNVHQLALYALHDLDKKFAHCIEDQQTIEIKKLLTDLLDTIPDIEQRNYLNETIICFKHKAYRAAITMAWNLGYDHLCRYIFEDQTRLDEFNKHATKSKVTVLTDFAANKESLVLQWSRAANIIEKNTLLILEAALDRRNMAAHPSNIIPS
jgi:hypothetical protein